MRCCNDVVLLIWFGQMPSVYFAFLIVVVIVISTMYQNEVARLTHVALSLAIIVIIKEKFFVFS